MQCEKQLLNRVEHGKKKKVHAKNQRVYPQSLTKEQECLISLST